MKAQLVPGLGIIPLMVAAMELPGKSGPDRGISHRAIGAGKSLFGELELAVSRVRKDRPATRWVE